MDVIAVHDEFRRSVSYNSRVCQTIKRTREIREYFITSEAGDTVDLRPYGLSKITVNSFIKDLAHSLKLSKIRVNGIGPGITVTDMSGLTKENLYAWNYGAGRFYLPEEIAEVAAFIVSDASSCISGQIITCNKAETVNARWKK